MISPLWGYYDVAPMGLLGYRPAGAIGMLHPERSRGVDPERSRGGGVYVSDFSSRLRSTSSFHAEASVHRAELKNSPRPTGTPLYEENEIHLLNYSFLSRHRIHGRSMMRKMFKFCQAWKITCMHGIVLPKDQISLR